MWLDEAPLCMEQVVVGKTEMTQNIDTWEEPWSEQNSMGLKGDVYRKVREWPLCRDVWAETQQSQYTPLTTCPEKVSWVWLSSVVWSQGRPPQDSALVMTSPWVKSLWIPWSHKLLGPFWIRFPPISRSPDKCQSRGFLPVEQTCSRRGCGPARFGCQPWQSVLCLLCYPFVFLCLQTRRRSPSTETTEEHKTQRLQRGPPQFPVGPFASPWRVRRQIRTSSLCRAERGGARTGGLQVGGSDHFSTSPVTVGMAQPPSEQDANGEGINMAHSLSHLPRGLRSLELCFLMLSSRRLSSLSMKVNIIAWARKILNFSRLLSFRM